MWCKYYSNEIAQIIWIYININTNTATVAWKYLNNEPDQICLIIYCILLYAKDIAAVIRYAMNTADIIRNINVIDTTNPKFHMKLMLLRQR